MLTDLTVNLPFFPRLPSTHSSTHHSTATKLFPNIFDTSLMAVTDYLACVEFSREGFGFDLVSSIMAGQAMLVGT